MRAALTADAAHLFHGLEDVVRFAAHVDRHDGTVFGHDLRELDQLLGMAVDAGHVDQAQGHAEGTGFQLLPEQGLHGLKLFGRRVIGLGIGHAHIAQGAVPYEHAVVVGAEAGHFLRVGGDVRGLDVRHFIGFEAGGPAGFYFSVMRLGAVRHEGAAAVAVDGRRHALMDVAFIAWRIVRGHVGMSMDIDEAGRHRQAAYVPDMLGGQHLVRDTGNAVAAQIDIGIVRAVSGAIRDGSAHNSILKHIPS